jgi:hypothetical protein
VIAGTHAISSVNVFVSAILADYSLVDEWMWPPSPPSCISLFIPRVVIVSYSK